MKALLALLITAASFAANATPTKHYCMDQILQDNELDGDEFYPRLSTKAEVRENLDRSDMDQHRIDELRELLEQSNTIPFDMEHDMGYFVIMVDRASCETLGNYFVLGY